MGSAELSSSAPTELPPYRGSTWGGVLLPPDPPTPPHIAQERPSRMWGQARRSIQPVTPMACLVGKPQSPWFQGWARGPWGPSPSKLPHLGDPYP